MDDNVHYLVNWSRSNKMLINYTKTKEMILGNADKMPKQTGRTKCHPFFCFPNLFLTMCMYTVTVWHLSLSGCRNLLYRNFSHGAIGPFVK